VLNMHMRPKFLAGKEIEAIPADPEDGRTHGLRNAGRGPWLGRGPHGSGHWPRQGDRHKEILGVEIIFPRLVHHPKQPVGSSIAVWKSPIQATHEK
jgi:hypothetical protein